MNSEIQVKTTLLDGKGNPKSAISHYISKEQLLKKDRDKIKRETIIESLYEINGVVYIATAYTQLTVREYSNAKKEEKPIPAEDSPECGA